MSREVQGEIKPPQRLFVPSDVDDAGLSPLQFRVLGHLSRRAGSNGLIYSSISGMAAVCGLDEKTVKKALRELEELGVIQTNQRSGLTSNRVINPVSQWKATPTQKTTPPKKQPGSQKGLAPHPRSTPTPLPKFGLRRVSIKGIPKKVIQFALPDSLNSEDFKAAWTEWTEHLDAKRKHLSPQSAKAQLAKCEQWGAVRAVNAIGHSIANNWQGLYEERAASGKTPSLAPTSAPDSFWHDLIEDVCRDAKAGEFDRDYVRKKIDQVREYAEEAAIWAYVATIVPSKIAEKISAMVERPFAGKVGAA